MTSRLPGLFQGDRVRAYQQLRILGRRHRVTLVSFASRRQLADAPADLAAHCARVVTVPLDPVRMAVAGLRGGGSPRPLQVSLFQSRRMRDAIAAARRGEAFDVAHVQLARMGSYLDDVRPLPCVVDLVDALSLNMQRRAAHERAPWRWLFRHEARRLRRYERHLCERVGRVLVGSPAERDALGAPSNLVAVTSGVDLAAFPFGTTARASDTVVFSGNLGYFPNVRAALWLGRTILPLVQRAIPAVQLHLVGRRPARPIRQLAREHPSISLARDVVDVAPHLARAAVAVAPMQAGSGQPLKILEAMASGTPVVATPLAVSGIEARDREHLLVAGDADRFAADVVRVLRDPGLAIDLAIRGRRLVEARYTWEGSVAALEDVYDAVVAERG